MDENVVSTGIPSDEKDEKIRDLRSNLKDGRTSKASTGPGGDGQGDGRTSGSRIQNTGRGKLRAAKDNAGTAGSSGPSDTRRGSAGESFERSGRDNGRPGEGDGGPANHAEGTGSGETRRAGRLETNDPIPDRVVEEETPDYTFGDVVSLAKNPVRYKEDYKRSTRDGQKVYTLQSDTSQWMTPEAFKELPTRDNPVGLDGLEADSSTKSSPSNPKSQKPQWFKESKVLSVKEAEELFEPLIAALQSGFEYIDRGIWLYCMSSDQLPIWSDLSDKEVKMLASILLKRGQRNPETAAVIRGLVDMEIYIAVGAITIPRAITTFTMLKGSPRPAMRKKQQAARREARLRRVGV